MKLTSKKILSLMLCVLLAAAMLPKTAKADETAHSTLDLTKKLYETEITTSSGIIMRWRPEFSPPVLTVVSGGTYTVESGHGFILPEYTVIKMEAGVHLTIISQGGGDGIYVKDNGVLKLSGATGSSLTCIGANGITAGVVGLTEGRLVALGAGGYGLNIDIVSFDKEVSSILAAGTAGGIAYLVVNMPESRFLTVANEITGIPNDLSNIDEITLFTGVGGGAALWEPGITEGYSQFNRLTLTAAAISGGLKLPEGSSQIDFAGKNTIDGGISLAGEKMANSLSLAGIGSLECTGGFSNVEFVVTGAPGAEAYATAVAGDDGAGAVGIPGSAYPAGSAGIYFPKEESYFKLEYKPVSLLEADDFLLTVEDGFGGGIYQLGSAASIKFNAANYNNPFSHWEAVDEKHEKIEGSDSWFGNVKNPHTVFTPPVGTGLTDSRVTVRGVVDESITPGPGPSLEKGEHISYLNGYPDNTIRPESRLTREETAQLFYNLMDEASRIQFESGECPFIDVRAGKWSYKAICTLANGGILQGDINGRFRPGDYITRAEFATIAARFDPGTYSGGDLFPDIAGHWAREDINYAASRGWIQGYKDGAFRPNEKITRAEAVTMINRFLERTPEVVEDLLEGRRVFTDNTDQSKWYYLALEEAANSHDYRRKNYTGPQESWIGLK